MQVTLTAANGAVTLSGTAGLTFSTGDGTADASMTFSGTVTDINTALDGLTFDPSSDFNGAASLQIVTDDLGNSGAGGNLTDSDTVNISVTAANDGPTNSVPGAQSTLEDTALTFSTAGGNLISISDSDAGASPVQVTLTAANGAVTLSGTAGLTFSTGDGTADATMTFSGTVTDINTALDGLTFDPTSDFNGAASLQIVTDDLGNSGTGGNLTDTDTVNISVTADNDAPTNSVPGPQSALEDTALTFSTAGGNLISISDSDAGASPLQVKNTPDTRDVTQIGTCRLKV